jgi:hypothetical protein
LVRRALLRGLKPPAPSEKTWAKADFFAALRNDKQRTGNGKSNGQYGDSGCARMTAFDMEALTSAKTAFDTSSGAEVYTGLSVLTEEAQPILQ